MSATKTENANIMETTQTTKKIKHLAIKPTLLSMPVGGSLVAKYTEISSVSALQAAISRLNLDKRIVNEYEYSQEPTLGGILITRIR